MRLAKNSTTGYIYALIDKRNGELFYVGLTSSTLDRRLKRHFSCATKPQPGTNRKLYYTKCAKYIREATPSNVRLVVLGEHPVQELPDREIKWVSLFKELGVPLTNMTKGGEGTNGAIVNRGERNGRRVLSQSEVNLIRNKYVRAIGGPPHKHKPAPTGCSTAELALDFGVTRRTIERIVSGRTWKC